MRRTARVLVLSFAGQAGFATAEAQLPRDGAEPRTVSLAVDACASDLAADAARIAAVELARPVRLAQGGSPARDGALVVEVMCADDALVVRTLAPVVTKRLALAHVDVRVRGRVLALAIAELVEGVASEPTPAPESPKPPRVAVTAAASAPAAPPAGLRAATSAGGLARIFAAGAATVGVRAGVLVPLGDRLVLACGALAERGGLERDLGRVDLSSYAGEALLGLRFGGARLGVTAAAGLQAGYVVARGEPARPAQFAAGSVSGAWVGPLGRVRGRVGITRQLELGLGLDLGFVPWTIRAGTDGRDERVWQGTFAAVAAEAGWAW